MKRKIRMWLKKKQKRFLDVHIVEHCNLNCKSCAHFSPIAEKSYISLDELEQMYKNLQPIYDKFFNSIHLMGGEPLLHPKINQIIKLTRKYFSKTEIQIVTNGIKLMETSEDFINTCKENYIILYISQYPIAIDYTQICKRLEEHKIRYIISDKIDHFLGYSLDYNGKQNPSDSYRKCEYAGFCIQLKHNKLFPCFQCAHIEHINKYFNTNFMYEKGDYLDLDFSISKKSFRKFISTPRPFCKYCKMDEQHKITWGISQKVKEEWISSKY